MQPRTVARRGCQTDDRAGGDLHRYRPLLSQRSQAAHAAGDAPYASAHISIRMPAGQSALGPAQPNALAFQLPMAQELAAQQQLRLATGELATSGQLRRQASDPQAAYGGWLKTRRADPAGEVAPAHNSSQPQPDAHEPWQQQPTLAAQFRLPLTAAQSQQIVSRLYGLEPSAAQQQAWTVQPLAGQPLNIVDWQPSATLPAWQNPTSGDMPGNSVLPFLCKRMSALLVTYAQV